MKATAAPQAMARRAAVFFGAILCLLQGMSAFAAEFRSIGERPAILYDAPATKASKLHILGAYQPVEVVIKLDKWSKVRDVSGEFAWVDNSLLSDRRLVVVQAERGEIRKAAAAAAPLAFEARRGVVLEMTGPVTDGFIPVRHRDGSAGFLAVAQAWGL
jgi:SH3-like domain-containing protein